MKINNINYYDFKHFSLKKNRHFFDHILNFLPFNKYTIYIIIIIQFIKNLFLFLLYI